MPPPLLRAILTELGAQFLPVFVASDHQNKEDLRRLHSAGSLSLLPDSIPPHMSMVLDQYLLTQATVFVGNPASTLSGNVCRFRQQRGCFFFHPPGWENPVDSFVASPAAKCKPPLNLRWCTCFLGVFGVFVPVQCELSTCRTSAASWDWAHACWSTHPLRWEVEGNPTLNEGPPKRPYCEIHHCKTRGTSDGSQTYLFAL
jgi:hypothetical protein